MSRQSSEKKTLTTHDVSAYFSEEEWTLLQEWQKELYRNVMNEIHQALIALGPLIATSVSSSRAKEKEDVYPVINKDSEGRYSDDCCLTDAVDDFDVMLGVNQEKNKYMKNHQSTQRNEDNTTVAPPAVHGCLNEEKKYFREAEQIESMSLGLNRSIKCTKQQETSGWERKLACDFGRNTSQNPKSLQKVCPLEESYAYTEYKSTFNQKSNILEHNNKKCQKSYTLTECETSLNESSKMEQHQAIKSTLQMCICGQCGRCFNQSSNVITDQLISNSHQPNTCSECMKVVCFSSNLNKDQERPYKCSDCGKSFKTSQTLIRHRRMHTGERPYVCSECGKSFRRPHTLMTHQLLHTGDKPYTCITCGRNFRQIPHLMKHQRTHMREKELE
ncbi:zinc finger protein 773-like isoform X2 [Pleurodeles waltl]|uniref:zinc finger protein 773-like isoform X2 n=1 Tax=Pleurodeles waltl TaxID=8319 RepID=UPI003709BFEE